MGRGTKLILALLVLIGGVALAWQYRQHGGEGPVDSAAEKPFSAAQLAATDSSAHSSPIVAPHDSSANPPATASAAPASLSKSDDAGIPNLPHAFTGSATSEGNNGSTGDSPRLGSLSGGGQEPIHKVADGDTLIELAKRYLGSANRWSELYDYNRDVLANPDLLPIGAELRIPVAPFRPAEKDAPQSGATPSTQPPTARPVSQRLGVDSSGAQTADDLVPVPSSAPGVEKGNTPGESAAGKLRRLPPVGPAAPIGRVLRVAPRTYVVQPGDTLNSIAERVYGDGAREDLLRDANRNLVSGGQSLLPGTVLVIPMSDR